MPIQKISAQTAIEAFSVYDAVIDARSESEFALDHLPQALNWPTLNDAQRHDIGTQYKQSNAFEAKKQGAALAAKNIAAHIERYVLALPKHWRPLIYCWRGGKRSGSLALVLSEIGFEVSLIEGGYKAFRAQMLQDLERLSQQFQFLVLCGPTGCGKTRILQTLAQTGEQVLDLEALAEHRSSVLGLIPGHEQPSQKQFDMRVWNALRQLNPQRRVWVESESKKVGNVSIAESLILSMRASACLRIEMSIPERVKFLMQDYDFYVQQPEFFCQRLDVLRDLRGHEKINAWQSQIRQGEIAAVVAELLNLHYDPGYFSSMQRNFAQYGSAKCFEIQDMQALNAPDFAQSFVRQIDA